MAFTSDQQLAALGLRRMEDLPRREGYQFIGMTHAYEAQPLTVVKGSFVLPNGSALSHHDLLGWRSR